MILMRLLAISLMMSSIDAWRILLLAPFPNYSHWTYIETIIGKLLENGHHITSISPYDYRLDDEKFFSFTIPEFPIEEHCE
jgi:hypothetical protein